MNTSARERAFAAFYENLAQVQRDIEYYLNPIGLSRRDVIVALMEASADALIADLGCGDGLIAVRLRRDNRRIVGCDLSLTRVRRAVANGIEAVCADVQRLPYPDGLFDGVVCSEVIEHVMNPVAVLGEICRALRYGGIAILTVPLDEKLDKTLLEVPESLMASGRYDEIKEQYCLKGSHLSSFTEKSFQKMLAESGFAVERVDFTYNYTLKHPYLLRMLKKLCYILIGRNPIAPLPHFLEAIVGALIRFCYQREKTRHHIVVQARKPGAQNPSMVDS